MTPIDGIERIVTFQRVNNAPYFLLVGLATVDHLDQWRRERNVAIMLLTGFVAITSLGGWMIWIIWRREREGAMLLAGANEQLSHSLREAQASERRFTTMFAASPYAMSLNSLPDARIADVNPAYCSLSGYAREELMDVSVPMSISGSIPNRERQCSTNSSAAMAGSKNSSSSSTAPRTATPAG